MALEKITGRAMALRGARLAAIQNCYAHFMNPDAPIDTKNAEAWLQSDDGFDDDEFDTSSPTNIKIDHALYKKLIIGFRNEADVFDKAKAVFEAQSRPLDHLLKAILLMALQELSLANKQKHHAVINEYVTLSASFYQQNEPALINRILQDIYP